MSEKVKIYLCDWINAYSKINSKLNKKTPLTTEEIEELTALVEKIQAYVNQWGFEVLKRQ